MSEQQRGLDTGSGPSIPIMEDDPPIDVDAIRQAIRQVTESGTVPIALRIDHLTDKLRGQLGLLLLELGDPEKAEDYELRTQLREATALVEFEPNPEAPRRERWEHVGILAASTKGLLRQYEERTAG